MTTRADIVDAARQWLGTRYRHQASLRGVGCDCIGLIAGVARECGIVEGSLAAADPDCRGYARTPAPALIAACERYLDPVDRPELGDVLVMRFEREPQHFGILSCLEPRRMIHAYTQMRRVVEHGIDDTWQGRILRAYRFRGVS